MLVEIEGPDKKDKDGAPREAEMEGGEHCGWVGRGLGIWGGMEGGLTGIGWDCVVNAQRLGGTGSTELQKPLGSDTEWPPVCHCVGDIEYASPH